jgi:hypothetical protein
MTRNSNEKNHEHNEIDKIKRKENFLIKLLLLVSGIFFAYIGFKYWQVKKQQNPAEIAEKSESEKSESEKYDDVNGEIFDLSATAANSDDLSDLTVNEMKEKGAEFIYRMLFKNQLQINHNKEQIQSLKNEILQYKNREKIARIIFSYIDFRQRIYDKKPYEQELQNFEMLASFDENLQNKITKLRLLLPNFLTRDELIQSFAALIPDIIVAKKNIDANSGFIARIRYNISRLVIIRKINEENADEVDKIIIRTEKFLRAENYQEALLSLLFLRQKYHQILKVFLDDLNVAAEVQKIDREILNYLKNLA